MISCRLIKLSKVFPIPQCSKCVCVCVRACVYLGDRERRMGEQRKKRDCPHFPFFVCSPFLMSIKDQPVESKLLDPLKTINSGVFPTAILSRAWKFSFKKIPVLKNH